MASPLPRIESGEQIRQAREKRRLSTQDRLDYMKSLATPETTGELSPGPYTEKQIQALRRVPKERRRLSSEDKLKYMKSLTMPPQSAGKTDMQNGSGGEEKSSYTRLIEHDIDPKRWDMWEVGTWLKEQDLTCFGEIFREQKMTGSRLLRVRRCHLEQLGIRRTEARRRLLKCLKALRAKHRRATERYKQQQEEMRAADIAQSRQRNISQVLEGNADKFNLNDSNAESGSESHVERVESEGDDRKDSSKRPRVPLKRKESLIEKRKVQPLKVVTRARPPPLFQSHETPRSPR
eukprot:707017_1